jgi:hypothetical protein
MRFPLLAVGVLLIGACTHRSPEAGDTTLHDPELITSEELADVKGSTVYAAVQELRPNWFMRVQPNPALPRQTPLIVYVDGQRLGAGIDALRTISIMSAVSVQFFSPTAAQGRFGPGHSLGAIEVITKPGQ